MRAQLTPVLGAGEARAAERIIFEEMMLMSPVDVLVNPQRELPDFIDAKLRRALARIVAGEPLQYVLGHARFMGMDLMVTPAVLIPRPETEGLVDIIVDRYGGKSDLRVLDVCTGSGCIALALARNLPFACVTGVDLSDAALEVARHNAAELHCRVDFVRADALNLQLPGEWDIIVSNPPYVMQSEADAMQPQVLDHEPRMALFVPDDDAMCFYDAITAYARRTRAGALYYEINPLCAGRFTGADIVKDIHGRDRYAIYDPLNR